MISSSGYLIGFGIIFGFGPCDVAYWKVERNVSRSGITFYLPIEDLLWVSDGGDADFSFFLFCRKKIHICNQTLY